MKKSITIGSLSFLLPLISVAQGATQSRGLGDVYKRQNEGCR